MRTPVHVFDFMSLSCLCFCFCLSFMIWVTFWVTLCFVFAVWSVARTTLAVPWPAVPGTACPPTPPRCTPYPRPAAQGRSWGPGPARSPADRHKHSPLANSQWAWRRPMVAMMATALRDLPTFQSVGEWVSVRDETQEWNHQQVTLLHLYHVDCLLYNRSLPFYARIHSDLFYTPDNVLWSSLRPSKHKSPLVPPIMSDLHKII